VRLLGERAARRVAGYEKRGKPKGYLRSRTVTDKTAEKYRRLHENFLAHARIRRRHPDDVELLDPTLDQYLDEKYLAGFPPSVLRDTAYAVAWHADLTLRDLPLSQKALRGVRKLCPDTSRNPATWEAVLLIVDELTSSADSIDVLAGAAAIIQFDTYARPSALLNSQESDLFPPARGSSRTAWSLTFWPSTKKQTSKTGTQDDTVALGQNLHHRDDLHLIAQALKKRTPKGGKLFPLGLATYGGRLRAAADRLGLPGSDIVPHMLRHGGASMDALHGVPRSDIQERGQWAVAKSVQRYSKHGRYLRELHRLTTAQLKKATALSSALPRRLAARLSSLPYVPIRVTRRKV
jgi:hypothetical protein